VLSVTLFGLRRRFVNEMVQFVVILLYIKNGTVCSDSPVYLYCVEQGEMMFEKITFVHVWS
jgi:hypothetical protein